MIAKSSLRPVTWVTNSSEATADSRLIPSGVNLSFADFEVRDGSERLYPAPTSATDSKHKSAPDLTSRGRLHFLEHETGLEPATPTLAISFSAIPSSSVDVHSRPDSRS